jgi:hypothetical protein
VIPPVRARTCPPNGQKPALTPPSRLYRADVDLSHLHHRLERSHGCSRIGIGDRLRQGDRRNLPGYTPVVLAPAALFSNCMEIEKHRFAMAAGEIYGRPVIVWTCWVFLLVGLPARISFLSSLSLT